MLTLAWPWLLVLLPLPWLYRYIAAPLSRSAPALRSRLYTNLALSVAEQKRQPRSWFLQGLLTVGWIALLIAAARPQWIGEPIALPTSGRDLLIAVDISGSMETEDMAYQGNLYPRLTVVKSVVGEFVKHRSGDKLGLILFGDKPYLQTPLTFDHKTLYTLLQEARIGFAGKATAIGDAIGLAIKHLKTRPESDRVLILLSDGADTASEIPPRKAAELASQYQIRIYTIGVGAEQVAQRGFFGLRRINPSSDLDEDTLQAIADTTGGQYFRARNTAELATIYGTLDELEPVEQEAETLRPTKSLFYWPLTIALLAFLLTLALSDRAHNP